jgi:uracil-DNA glycosylase family 4
MGGEMKSSEQNINIGDVIALLEYYSALGVEAMSVTLPELPVDSRSGSFPKKIRLSAVAKGKSTANERASLLEHLRAEIGDCTRCKLSEQRRNIVFGEGNPGAKLLFIGEGPGREEDLQGRPFVGDAGALLTKLIEKMGLKRGDVYIGNIVKCRPPMNRDPEGDEVTACRPFIEKQVEIIQPQVIVTLGRIALQSLLGNASLKISAARGSFLEFRGIPLMPTFHPAYLLRNPRDKWLTWSDMQRVLERLGDN